MVTHLSLQHRAAAFPDAVGDSPATAASPSLRQANAAEHMVQYVMAKLARRVQRCLSEVHCSP